MQPELLHAEYTGTWPVILPASGNINQNTGTIPVGREGSLYYIDIGTLANRMINNGDEKGNDLDIEVYFTDPDTNIEERYTYENFKLVSVTDSSNPYTTTKVGIGNVVLDPTSNNNPNNNTPKPGSTVRIVFKDYVYLSRESKNSDWVPQEDTITNRSLFLTESNSIENALYTRREGRYPLNFAWFHHTPRLHLVDPAATNIIDLYIITVGYYIGMKRFIENKTDIAPQEPTPLELRNTYANLIDNKMISDTVILHPGRFKLLFGSRAEPQLRCKFKVIRAVNTTMTDNQVKVRIIDTIRSFFDINSWQFGEVFYFSELSASIHSALGPEIDSIVLVPLHSQHFFGDLFQVLAREDEMFIPDVNTSDIEIVQSYTPENLKQL